ncbi:MAG: prepilin-type N-terminal cleavage/methylation domain-containing protein [Clostridiaceae bacterium]|nr:prepilin-type N-terminal cleavage/methylation domain-containing protein [Clostridiaceae bacterium]
MRSIKERLNKKGFTLAELLIVVAIIAVLVAVSVPVFNSKLERSREAADVANMRAAKAAAVAAYLNGELDITKTLYYDAENGIITDKKPKTYGQGTKTDGKTTYLDYTGKTEAKGKAIIITITPESDTADIGVKLEWN